MNLTDKQINLLNRQKVVVLATSSRAGRPHAIFVEVNRVNDDKIIITDNLMTATKKNFLENKQVTILAFNQDYSYCLKIFGEAGYYTRGEYFDFVKNLETNKNYSPKGAVIITVREINELK